MSDEPASETDEIEQWASRPRGGLSSDDRRWLLSLERPNKDSGEEVPEISESDSAIYHRERRIRQRIRNALIDFEVLAEYNDENIQKVFESLRQSLEIGIDALDDDDYELSQGIRAVFELLYMNLGDPNPESPYAFTPLFDHGVGNAVSRMNAERGVSVSVRNIGIQAEIDNRVAIEDVKADFDDGEFLMQWELQDLLWAGKIDHDEYRDAIKELYRERNELVKEFGEEEAGKRFEQRVRRREEQRAEMPTADYPDVRE